MIRNYLKTYYQLNKNRILDYYHNKKLQGKKPETGKTTSITNQIQEFNKEFKDKDLIFQDFNKK